jgi:hypothetical protein
VDLDIAIGSSDTFNPEHTKARATRDKFAKVSHVASEETQSLKRQELVGAGSQCEADIFPFNLD